MGTAWGADAERVFQANRHRFRGMAGYFAMIRGNELVAVVATRALVEDAVTKLYGTEPLYVREITPEDVADG